MNGAAEVEETATGTGPGREEEFLAALCARALASGRRELLLAHREGIEALPDGVLRTSGLAILALSDGDLPTALAMVPGLETAAVGSIRRREDAAHPGVVAAAALADIALAAAAVAAWVDAGRCVAAARRILTGIGVGIGTAGTAGTGVGTAGTAGTGIGTAGTGNDTGADAPFVALDLLAISALVELHTFAGDEEFRALADALRGARTTNTLTDGHVVALVCLGHVQHLRGELGEAAVNLARGLRLAGRARPGIVAHARIELAFIRVRQGRWDDADALVDETESLSGAVEQRWMEPQIVSVRALMRILRGDLAAGTALLEHAAALARDIPSFLSAIVMLHARVVLTIAAGDWVALERLLDDAGEPGYRHPYRPGEWHALRLLAASHLGYRASYRRLLAEWGAQEESRGDPYYWAFAAIDAERASRRVEGLHATDAALACLAPSDDPLGRAWVRMVVGSFLAIHAEGDAELIARAGATWSEATAELRRLGADALAARCEGIVQGTRERLGHAAAADPLAALTPQQRRVAEWVAQGYTSEEIASILSLSHRTVDYHVGRIMRAIGATSRREIRRLLSDA